jgi:adenine-specific DNA methylase
LFSSEDWSGAKGLAEDVRRYGAWMRAEAEKRIGHLYPKIEVTAEMAAERPDLKPLVGEKLTVIAGKQSRAGYGKGGMFSMPPGSRRRRAGFRQETCKAQRNGVSHLRTNSSDGFNVT